MNEVKLQPSIDSRKTAAIGSPRKWRGVWAFVLGLVGLFLMFFLGETSGERALYGGLGPYFLLSQGLLSRGNPRAIRQDWPIILTLNSLLLISAVLAWCLESRQQGVASLMLALFTIACSVVGAAVSAWVAARACRSRLPSN